MHQSRGIIKSIKNIPTDTDNKKVQLIIHHSHKLIHTESDIDQEILKDLPRRPKNKNKLVKTRSERTIGSENRSTKGRERSIKIKGCLKRDASIKNICDQDECKSSKSIKFNIKHNDVFEYTIGEKQSRKKTTKKIQKQKVQQACCDIY